MAAETIPEPPTYACHKVAARKAYSGVYPLSTYALSKARCFIPSDVVWGARFFEPPDVAWEKVRPYQEVAYLGYHECATRVTILSKPRKTELQVQVLIQVQGEAYPRSISVKRLLTWVWRETAREIKEERKDHE